MSPAVAMLVITWVALVVLYLGLAACLREVRMLRAQVMRMTVVTPSAGAASPAATPADEAPALELPGVVRDGTPAVVLAADSTCPLCRLAMARLAQVSTDWPEPPVLLTYETEQEWGALPPGLRVVRDEQAWSQIAHLTPPVLLQVTGRGTVTALALPDREDDVDTTLTSWGVPTSHTRK